MMVTYISTQTQVPTTPVPEKYHEKKIVFRTYQVIWLILGFIESLLAFRIVLKMFAANAGSGFADLVYTLSAPFAAPFRGLFATSAAERNIIEWSTMFGMIVYLIVAYGLVKLLQLIKPTTPHEVEHVVETQV